jgi:Ca2+-transporting ATPase
MWLRSAKVTAAVQLATRSDRDTLWKIGLFSNRTMLGAVLLTFVLQLAVIYVPFLNRAFNTTPLRLRDLLISLAFGSIIFLAVEFFKWVRLRRK